jgi:hypothetical protein
MIQWNPTPYRKRKDDEYADVDGFGRFRVVYDKDAGGFVVRQNTERIGSIHATAEAAKHAVAGIVEVA